MLEAGAHRTWTVRVSRDDSRDGQSVWDGCPYETGTPIYLNVLDLPVVAVRIGDSKGRIPPPLVGSGPLQLPGAKKWANGLISLNPGPWPGDATLLRVGCALYVIPAWDAVQVPMVTGLEHPEPVFGSLSGVDVRGLDHIEVWASVAPSVVAPNENIRAYPWVRHSTGIWAQPQGTFAPPSAHHHHFVVPCRGADRVAVQVEYVQPLITPGGLVAYGIMTPPNLNLPTTSIEAPDLTVRFGAILAHEPGARNAR